jgi:hypothetical protein
MARPPGGCIHDKTIVDFQPGSNGKHKGGVCIFMPDTDDSM